MLLRFWWARVFSVRLSKRLGGFRILLCCCLPSGGKGPIARSELIAWRDWVWRRTGLDGDCLVVGGWWEFGSSLTEGPCCNGKRQDYSISKEGSRMIHDESEFWLWLGSLCLFENHQTPSSLANSLVLSLRLSLLLLLLLAKSPFTSVLGIGLPFRFRAGAHANITFTAAHDVVT